MIYITGDKHGRFDSIEYFCDKLKTTKSDTLIVLGDLGLNYFGRRRDRSKKNYLARMPITIITIRGNHERRPDPSWNVRTVATDELIGTFIVEPGYESILYAQDGRAYHFKINGEWKSALVIGGAYSVDKYYRLGAYAAGNHDMLWFDDEQLSKEEMRAIKNNLLKRIATEEDYDPEGSGFPNYILSHTCPLSMEPVDMFLPQIDQSTVDTSTEEFLDDIKSILERNHVKYEKWYCGHWHTDRTAPDNFRFVFNDFISPGVSE